MLTYALRRLLTLIPVLFGVTVATFALIHLLPGDPIAALFDPTISSTSQQEYIEERRRALGLDQPMPVQYLIWLRELVTGNLGTSFRYDSPVLELIWSRIGATALLGATAIVIALALGVPSGIWAALRQNRLPDYITSIIGMGATSIPSFFLALLGIYVFAVVLGWLPSAGLPAGASPGDVLAYLVLPASVLALGMVGPYARYTRQGLLDALRQEYVVTARAKGASTARVVGHALRNSLIPLTTVVALDLPILVSGTVIVETIFSWPGLGTLAFNAVDARDYSVILGVVIVVAVAVMLLNLVADIVVAMLDPRIRQ